MDIITLKGALNSNAYVVNLDGTYIVIDAGAPVDAVKSALGGHKPSAIFLTHEHFDHIIHVSDYASNFIGCPIYCHPATLNELKTNDLNSFLVKSFDSKLQVKRVLRFDFFKTLSDGQTISVLPLSIKAVFAPGHSTGSVVYLVSNLSTTICFTGDVLFKGSIGRTDLIPQGDAQMRKSLRNLQNIKFDKSYHGHGPACDYKEQQKNIKNHLG